jgi:uncharacterized membrane protein YqjE
MTSLIRDLAESATTLVRAEAKLARIEVAAAMHGVARGSVLIAAGAVLALLGLLSLVAGVILLIGDQWLPRDRYWLAALIVVGISGALAWFFARRGMSRLAPSALAPEQTIETLKEDTAWLKQRMTSGATSN